MRGPRQDIKDPDFPHVTPKVKGPVTGYNLSFMYAASVNPEQTMVSIFNALQKAGLVEEDCSMNVKKGTIPLPAANHRANEEKIKSKVRPHLQQRGVYDFYIDPVHG